MKKQSNEATTTAGALADLRRMIRIEGAAEAFKALREVCNDPKAAAPARATAASAIFRAAGLFDKVEGGDGDKNLSEMSPGELDRAIKSSERLLKRSEAELEKRASFNPRALEIAQAHDAIFARMWSHNIQLDTTFNLFITS